MKISRRAAGGLAVLAAVSLVAAGCSNPGSSGSGSQASSADYWPTTSTNLSGVTLDFWVAQNSNKVPVKVVNDFEAKTGAKINLTTIPDPYEQTVQTKITTGNTPDLAFWQPTKSMLVGFVSQNKLQSLDNAPWMSDYKEGIADSGGVYNGTRYGMIISMPDVMGVWYNKEVYQKAGISSTPKSWNDFVSDMQKIKATNVSGVESPLFEMGGSQWGTQYAVQIQLAEAAQGGLWDRVNTGKEKFTDPTILTAIENYKKFFNEGLYNSDAGSAKDTDQATALLGGKTSSIICVNSQFNSIAALASNDKNTLDQKIGFYPLSANGNIATVIPEQINGLVAFKTGDSKREAAARQFIRFWMTDEYSSFVENQGIPSVLKSVSSPDTVPQALLDAANAIQGGVGSMQSLAIANPDLYINLADMINGTKTPEQVADTTQQQFAQLAKAQGVSGF